MHHSSFATTTTLLLSVILPRRSKRIFIVVIMSISFAVLSRVCSASTRPLFICQPSKIIYGSYYYHAQRLHSTFISINSSRSTNNNNSFKNNNRRTKHNNQYRRQRNDGHFGSIFGRAISTTNSISGLVVPSTSDTLFSNLQDNNNNIITSTKSNTIKKVQALLQKRKKRMEWGQTIVEGPRMVFDLINNPSTRPLVKQIIVSVDKFSDYQQEILKLQTKIDNKENNDTAIDTTNDNSMLHIQLTTPEVLQSCSDTITPQGIIAIVNIPTWEQLLITNREQNQSPFYLILDGVSDPGNVGTLIRSSLAVGVAGIILLPHCCDVWNPKAVRSAMGASFQVPILENINSWESCLEILKSLHVKNVHAATMETGEDGISSHKHYAVNWIDQPSGLVIGSEGNGLSHEIRKSLGTTHLATGISIQPVHVPMNAGIESLNAAICGSVILFEYLRQFRQQT